MYQYDNKYTLAKYAAKILTQTKMPKENARKKAVKPKFHRLSFLKRGDVNK